jgi:hypothetical protein
MTEGTITKEAALLEDSTFNVITQIEKKADFLYSSVEKYIRDADKDKKPELVKLWSTMKEDEQKHLKMLRVRSLSIASRSLNFSPVQDIQPLLDL